MESIDRCGFGCPYVFVAKCIVMDSGVLRLFSSLCDRNLHFTVTSAKRTPLQNTFCGGARNSQHLFGCAVDIKPYGNTTRDQILSVIESLDYDQLILYPTFIHVSFVDDFHDKSSRHQKIIK